MAQAELRDDRVLVFTRVIAAIIVPILLLAFLILFFLPDQTGRRFAWEIKPHMTAMYMGAGYLGGAYLFARVIFERRWHRVAAAYLPVTAFTWSMLILTVLHWSRFDLSLLGFQLWLVLYIVTPFLVPFVWYRNRRTDPGTPEPDDVLVPQTVRRAVLALGAVILALSLYTFVNPAFLVGVWPWTLTPLSARVLAGWGMLLAVADIVIARDARWSSWRIGIHAMSLWHVLVLVAALLNPADFKSGLVNWYTVAVVLILAGIAGLYVTMESRRRGTSATVAVP